MYLQCNSTAAACASSKFTHGGLSHEKQNKLLLMAVLRVVSCMKSTVGSRRDTNIICMQVKTLGQVSLGAETPAVINFPPDWTTTDPTPSVPTKQSALEILLPLLLKTC
jgi:hypothetical protein